MWCLLLMSRYSKTHPGYVIRTYVHLRGESRVVFKYNIGACAPKNDTGLTTQVHTGANDAAWVCFAVA